jgi:hypothetical protein
MAGFIPAVMASFPSPLVGEGEERWAQRTKHIRFPGPRTAKLCRVIRDPASDSWRASAMLNPLDPGLPRGDGGELASLGRTNLCAHVSPSSFRPPGPAAGRPEDKLQPESRIIRDAHPLPAHSRESGNPADGAAGVDKKWSDYPDTSRPTRTRCLDPCFRRDERS